MKLYTENQVKMMLARAKLYRGAVHDNFAFIMSEDKILDSETSIEPPSDEEIGEFINTFPYTKQLDNGQFNDGVIYGATIGIDWMRNKIQGGEQ